MRDWLDSPSGHIAACILLVLIGGAFIKAGIAEGRDLILISSGALGRSMLGRDGARASEDDV